MLRIAVLVAVSIPIFTSQLEKSRDAVTVANLRTAYAEAATEYLTDNGTGHTSGNIVVAAPDTDSKVKVTVSNVKVKGTDASGLSDLEKELPFTVSDDNAKALNSTSTNNGIVNISFTYTTNVTGEPTFAIE